MNGNKTFAWVLVASCVVAVCNVRASEKGNAQLKTAVTKSATTVVVTGRYGVGSLEHYNRLLAAMERRLTELDKSLEAIMCKTNRMLELVTQAEEGDLKAWIQKE